MLRNIIAFSQEQILKVAQNRSEEEVNESTNEEVNMKLSKMSEVQQSNRNELMNLVELIASTTGIVPQGRAEAGAQSTSRGAEEAIHRESSRQDESGNESLR